MPITYALSGSVVACYAKTKTPLKLYKNKALRLCASKSLTTVFFRN